MRFGDAIDVTTTDVVEPVLLTGSRRAFNVSGGNTPQSTTQRLSLMKFVIEIFRQLYPRGQDLESAVSPGPAHLLNRKLARAKTGTVGPNDHFAIDRQTNWRRIHLQTSLFLQ